MVKENYKKVAIIEPNLVICTNYVTSGVIKTCPLNLDFTPNYISVLIADGKYPTSTNSMVNIVRDPIINPYVNLRGQYATYTIKNVTNKSFDIQVTSGYESDYKEHVENSKIIKVIAIE